MSHDNMSHDNMNHDNMIVMIIWVMNDIHWMYIIRTLYDDLLELNLWMLKWCLHVRLSVGWLVWLVLISSLLNECPSMKISRSINFSLSRLFSLICLRFSSISPFSPMVSLSMNSLKLFCGLSIKLFNANRIRRSSPLNRSNGQ